MQASRWDDGAAVYSLASGTLSWCVCLKVTALAADARSSQLALGTHLAGVVLTDAQGQPGRGLGLLGGLRLQAVRFYQTQQRPDLVRC